MLPLEEGLRHFWMRGLAEVRGQVSAGLQDWIVRGDYLVLGAPSATEFTIKSLRPAVTMSALASDCSRMACVSFESYYSLSSSRRLPRSCGWTCITAYYGAFFAAHSLLRMFGKTCFQIDTAQKAALEKNAKLFGMLPTNGFEAGFYIANYDSVTGELVCKKSAADKKGSHIVLWEVFVDALRQFSNELIAKSALYNDAALFISDLTDLLCQSGLNGTWLSNMRNAINYRHEHGAWFPYRRLGTDRAALLTVVSKWQKHPESISLRSPSDLLLKHVTTSTAIVSMCFLVVNDMANAGGIRSYHNYGALELARLAAQRD